jgi:hypothetical protein
MPLAMRHPDQGSLGGCFRRERSGKALMQVNAALSSSSMI